MQPGVDLEYRGLFETHITLTVTRASELDGLREWTNSRDLRFHHIILDRGQISQQPMVTQNGRGSLTSQQETACGLVLQLQADQFEVRRIKIEAAIGNEDVPASDFEAVRHHAELYFEHHVKLDLPIDYDVQRLTQLALQHAAHLSRNARKTYQDGRQERFVTQRCYFVGRETARSRFDALIRDLNQSGYPILKVEEEYVVYDSDPETDRGWLERTVDHG